ncbi:MAG TPA: murein biosynthesis integral membrane protein MurJ [Helicobacteraceae bacterium]|nr:murein biosynthesis integral membrane protein MurJ [Helicobacteraceae bacterium]
MFKSIFTNSFGILFSRILGFIRDLLTASILGANIYSDIFFIAFKLPNLFRRIFAEGAFTQAFLPAFTRSSHKALFATHIFMLFFMFIMLLTLIVNIFPQYATIAIALGFDETTIQLAAPYVAINFFYLPLIFAVTFLSTFLQYKHHFATTAFATGLLNIALIVALILSREYDQATIVNYLSYGVVVGGALQLIVHLIALQQKGLFKLLIGGIKYYRQKAYKITTESRRFTKQFFPAVWGNSSAQIAAFLDTWLASFLITGSISYLYYANRIFQLPLALFAIATSIALFPRVARHLKHHKTEEANTMLSKAFWFLNYILVVSALGGFILANEIITLLFEHGAFSADDTKNSALILQMYMLGLLPFGLQKLFALWLYAQERQAVAAKIATYSLASNVVLSLALIIPMGASGLALASTLSGFVSFLYTLKSYGYRNFLAIISLKKVTLWSVSALVTLFFLLIFKEFIHVYL